MAGVRAAMLISVALGVPWLAAASGGIYLDVPFIRQPREGCGAACLAMILEYWEGQDPGFRSRAPTGAREIQQQLYSRAAHGIYARDMVRYLDRSGMRTFVFAGGWADLEQHLGKGRPLIVCLKERGWRGSLHYVVVTGVASSREQLLVNDPARGRLIPMNRLGFEGEWKAAGFWTLLAVPRQTP